MFVYMCVCAFVCVGLCLFDFVWTFIQCFQEGPISDGRPVRAVLMRVGRGSGGGCSLCVGLRFTQIGA